MPTEAYRCSAASAALGESMAGTASTVTNWLLVEQPGPWGSQAVTGSRMPVRVARHLMAESRRHGVRVILLRRPGRDDADRFGREAFAVHTGPDRPWTAAMALNDPVDLLEVDLGPMASGRPPAGASLTEQPLLLVCTNGRRDPCCAERGRPLAGALAEALGPSVWECSHIGGDRFAGNLVCFPHGLYFGRLEPADGPAVARAYLDGQIDLEHFRGRSCHPFPVQAAEVELRRANGLTGLGDLRFERWDRTGPDTYAVRFVGPNGEGLETRVQVEPQEGRRLTCHAEATSRPPAYVVT